MKSQQVAALVDQLCSGLEELADIMQDPSSVSFGEVRKSFEALEKTGGHRSTIDASFAYLAQESDAGRIVHSSRAADYLVRRLGSSRKAAYDRLELGNQLFAPVAKPAEEEPVDAASADETLSEEEAKAAAEKREKAERARKEAEKQEELRRKMAKERQNELIHAIIRRELEDLNKDTDPTRSELYSEALERAKFMNPDRLRSWLRERVRRVNAKARNHDPHAATRRRKFKASRPDADGGVHISGYIDAATAALLEQAFSPAARPGGPELAPEDDKRTMDQRMADQLAHILHQYLGQKEESGAGLGSILITATLDDLEDMTAESRFLTSTGQLLSPMDILRLGIADNDYFSCLDPESFQPLLLGKTKRGASLMQKIALLASESVCTHPGCDAAWHRCDVHHLQAWAFGGPTDLRNLTLLCRRHHTDNNDYRDFRNNMGHAERDPRTGRVGFKAPGQDIEFNDSPKAQHSPAAKLRLKKRRRECSCQEEAAAA